MRTCGGRNKTSDNNSCDGSKKTKSRCKCYKDNKGCSDKCKCLNCRNPHGLRVATPVKKRAKKDNLVKYQRESTKAHLQSTGSKLPEGSWNEDETLLIIVLMKLKGDDAAFDQCLPKIYQNFRAFNQTAEFQLDIRDKSDLSVNGKVKHLREKEPDPSKK